MIDVTVRNRCGYSIAIVCTIIPPIDAPTTCARSMPSASSTAMPSAAMSEREYGTGGAAAPLSRALKSSAMSTATPSRWDDRPQSRLSYRMTKKPLSANS